MELKFHWRLLQGGEATGVTRAQMAQRSATSTPDLDAQLESCRAAEESGITALLTDLNIGKPDPMLLATALATGTDRISFMVAIRSGLLSPTLFVQQANTFSALTQGRICFNVVAGHSPIEQQAYGDFLAHDDRYARTAEFLAICHGLWHGGGDVNFHGRYYDIESGKLNTPFVSPDRAGPELFIAGSSDAARDLAIKYGSCWMRLADTPDNLKPQIEPVRAAGVDVGLRLSLIVRPTREAALQAARDLMATPAPVSQGRTQERAFVQHSDSVSIKSTFELAATEWLTPYLWTGAVRSHGATAMALVGTPEEVADAILAYKAVGISQFIFSGWPKRDEMIFFGKEVLPLVKRKEREPTLDFESAE